MSLFGIYLFINGLDLRLINTCIWFDTWSGAWMCVGGIILILILIGHLIYLMHYYLMRIPVLISKVSPHRITVVMVNTAFSAQHCL